ncbi:trigger factor [Microaerobacter geothermalis]|uniref:trigger factor n=1 Tax=Microaerobacter geothermalis TaxID=674972 RepID=UPI001F2F2AF3|nr:trigger factor [Microaerobacter geothermalis]MCF6092635.1 trigger factor [Microaerobacter geothermalis]
MVKASWEKTEKNKGILSVEVDEEQVAKALDAAFKKIVHKINVPGFRKGKVPRKIFEARFGVESLYQDALDILLPRAYGEAVEEADIFPVDRPEVDIEQLEAGKPLVFKATVTVKPEVELGEYKGLEVPEKDFSVSEEKIEDELKSMQERQAQLVVVEDGRVESGDFVDIDFEGFIDGQPFEGGKAEKYSLEIGSGTFIPGFEDQLIGCKTGDEKDIVVTFPEDYQSKDLAGKEALFKVKVLDIKRKELPAIDDEFAKDVSEFDTLEELKADIKNKLEERAQHEKEHYIRDTVVEKAAENATIEIPAVMIEHEVDHMIKDFEQNLKMQGMNLEFYYQYTGLDEAGLREQLRKDAEKRVRINLTLEAIAKAENVEVSEEDMKAEIARMAELYKRSEEEIEKILNGKDGMASLRSDLLIRKTVDLLVEHSKSVA